MLSIWTSLKFLSFGKCLTLNDFKRFADEKINVTQKLNLFWER